MLTIRRLVVVSGAAAVAASLVPALQAQTTCDWYAKKALQQQQDNERRGCGFKGPGWSSDFKAHMTWCASVSPEKWKTEAQRREQELAACPKKK
ncbi:MAG: hypothetical protein ACREC6_01395 [Hyphomicrobiaceae bacterium]